MSDYKTYPAYKDSGVRWIGNVPDHWDVASVKYYYDAMLGKMIQPNQISDDDTLVPYHRTQTVQWEKVVDSDTKEMWASPRDIEQFSLKKGDLLICEGGDVCRAAIIKNNPGKETIFQNSIHRVRPKGEYCVSWMMRLMQHLRSSGWVDVLCNKNTIVHFTSDKLGSLECPLPPPKEQSYISRFIDHETNRIDTLIKKKNRFIELLKEKRQALITHAVTKGLDPNVTMKDSGVEWIGKVPEHWETIKVARIGDLFKASGGTKRDNTDHGIPCIRYGDIYTTHEYFINKSRTYIGADKIGDYTKIRYGDALFAASGETFEDIGRSAVNLLKEKACCGGDVIILRPKINIDPIFLGYTLDSKDTKAQKAIMGKGYTVMHIYVDQIRDLNIAVPPLYEQESIGIFLKHETDRIDTLIEKTQMSIDLLKERRSAFITAAVTGQIDLRDEKESA